MAEAPTPLRDAEFGHEVRAALALRSQSRIGQDLAEERGGQARYRRDMLATLQRRELLRVAAGFVGEVGKPFAEAHSGERHVRPREGPERLIERSRDFTLVP